MLTYYMYCKFTALDGYWWVNRANFGIIVHSTLLHRILAGHEPVAIEHTRGLRHLCMTGSMVHDSELNLRVGRL